MSLLTDAMEKLSAEQVHWLVTRVFGVSLDTLHHEWLDDTAACCPCLRDQQRTNIVPTPREPEVLHPSSEAPACPSPSLTA